MAFLRSLPTKLDFKCTLYSCDIISLYTSITTKTGLEAIKYWIENKRELIPSRFSNEFILESLEFVLNNNNFIFDDYMFKQISGTAMGTKCAPPFACLTIGYQEETKLFPIELQKHFTLEECELIKKVLKRYMDDGFLFWPSHLNFDKFRTCLNSLDPAIKYTFEKAKLVTNSDGTTSQVLNFLDLKIILHDDNTVETDIYYKETDAHDYLPYNSSHPKHCKDNVPFNLAKRIIVFVSNPEKVTIRLEELRKWLKNCKYPDSIIDSSFHKAKLQGPAPFSNKSNNIPFVTTFHSNINNQNIVKEINQKIDNIQSNHLKTVFHNNKVILSQRQPKNLLRHLTKSKFTSSNLPDNLPNGLFKCKDIRCKICNLYINENSSFKMSNNQIWELRSHVTCRAINVVYYLKCNMCNKKTTYIGKTQGDNVHGFKQRMNLHISESKRGKSTCHFPKHVYECGIKNNCFKEPYFEINIMMSLKDPGRLEVFEKHFQEKGYDTLNNYSN